MLLIKNAHIRPMAGEDIANGEILIDGGKIAGIGVKVDAPEDAEIIDAEGRLVTPGIVEAHCHTGDSARAIGISPDHNEKNDPLTPQLRIMDSFNPYDPQLRRAIKAGVTSGVSTARQREHNRRHGNGRQFRGQAGGRYGNKEPRGNENCLWRECQARIRHGVQKGAHDPHGNSVHAARNTV
ncbi:MAG: hypothetical protein V8Q85_00115 [Christensenellales bacterium]